MKKYFFLAISLFIFSVNEALACACGCGILNVGTSSLIPNCEGGTAFLQYDYMAQTRNWNKDKDSSEHNHDKRIETQTYTAGAQYMFNRDWGAAIRAPYVQRYVQNLPHDGTMTHTKQQDIGDIRLNGIYSGLFDDMSTGITFGVKLPTGSTSRTGLNRNTQVGTGSTDSILGAYHMGTFGKESRMGYFVQGSWQRAISTHKGYTPGYELSGAVGTYYNLGQIGAVKRVAPIFQIIGTKKGTDSGEADPTHNQNSGYSFMYFAPGIEINFREFKLYLDVEFPMRRNVDGNQLVPQNLYKAILGYSF
jgi:hypothetical protein